MEKTLTFNNENERKGAELIIDNAISRSSLRWYSKSNPDSLSVEYQNVPDVIFTMVQRHRHWPFIEEVGKFTDLEDYMQTLEPRFDSAEDIEGTISEIKTELGDRIK